LRNLASSSIEDRERVTVSDLTDIDAAEDVIAANIAALEDAPQGPDPQDQRLDNLEVLLKNLSEGITERIDGVEQKIRPAEPVKVVIATKVPVIVPTNSIVGVIRNGTRAEYKVKHRELVFEGNDGFADESVVIVAE